MAEPFLSEIRMFSFGYAPKGWAQCNGQILPISQNQALFSLIGTFYGGNGVNTFALPNLQGRTPLHLGNGFVQGQIAGETGVTLITSQIPAHTHTVNANSGADSSAPTASTLPGGGGALAYGTILDTNMNTAIVGLTGGGQPHSNLQPYLVINFCIALQGIFPSRN